MSSLFAQLHRLYTYILYRLNLNVQKILLIMQKWNGNKQNAVDKAGNAIGRRSISIKMLRSFQLGSRPEPESNRLSIILHLLVESLNGL